MASYLLIRSTTSSQQVSDTSQPTNAATTFDQPKSHPARMSVSAMYLQVSEAVQDGDIFLFPDDIEKYDKHTKDETWPQFDAVTLQAEIRE